MSQSRNRQFLATAFLIFMTPFALAQQAPTGSQAIYPAQPVVPVPRGMSPIEEDAYRKAYADYQACLRSRAREVELSKAAKNLVALPRQRAFFEGELARRPGSFAFTGHGQGNQDRAV